MKKIALSILALSIAVLYAIPVSFNMNSINYSDCVSNQNYQKNLKIYNSSDTSQNITILHSNRSFSFSDTLFSIPAHDSIAIVVSFNGKHNILYKDVFYFTNSQNQNPSVLQAEAPVRYAQALYNSTYNLWDSQLKTALRSAVYNHTSLGYDTAREEMFGNIDNVNGSVECVYTGQIVQTTGIPNNEVMNCEHTWPQSMGASANSSVQKCDLHHLYPTNSTANSVRGNLPFGIVVNQNWSVGGSKRGTNAQGVTVFEPRNVHKGDCARSMFYFGLVYENPNSFLNSQEDVLRTWHTQDPVSTKETNRNNAIQEAQNNRNPFVDHPEFMERIYSISSNTSRPTAPVYYFPSQNISVSNQITFNLPITNIGNANLTISSVNSSNNAFIVGNFTSSINPGQFGTITVTSPTSSNSESTVITIQTNTGTKSINISTSTTSVDDISPVAKSISLNIYPNPVNNQATINVASNKNLNGSLTMDIFNAKGQKVLHKTYNNLNSNQISENVNFNNEKFSNGIYFVKVSQNGYSANKKILILK
jgi:endonuclease I